MKIADIPSAAAIIKAAQDEARVAYVEQEIGNDIIFGTARHIVTDPVRAGFAHGNDEFEGQFLRVTTTEGWEKFWPVERLVHMHQVGLFVTENVTFPGEGWQTVKVNGRNL